MNEREYVLGTDDEELQRLGLQHRLWSAQAFAIWERAGFGPGRRILDLGCGPGFAALDLCQLVGLDGHVLAIDESLRFIDHLTEQGRGRSLCNLEPHVADVQHLDIPPQSLDGAYARWVLCFVRDPEAVVRGVSRALRPGGVFAIQDYFNYASLTLAPRSPAFDRVIKAVSASWKSHGGDDDVAARLPAMLQRQGFNLREIKPILRIARPTDPLWAWPTSFFRSFTPRLVQMGLITEADHRAFHDDWTERSGDPNTFFVTPPVFDLIAEKV